jgi:hypothetical protein
VKGTVLWRSVGGYEARGAAFVPSNEAGHSPARPPSMLAPARKARGKRKEERGKRKEERGKGRVSSAQVVLHH